MNKKRLFTIFVSLLLISSCILLFKLYNENHSLKNYQGTKIHDNILNISGTLYDAKKDLSDSNISKLHRYYWQFNEFSKLDLPHLIIAYSTDIRNEYAELLRLNESNSSQKEINEVKNRLEMKLSKFHSALSLIMKECLSNDNMKFYSLNSEGNTTMNHALKILTEEK